MVGHPSAAVTLLGAVGAVAAGGGVKAAWQEQ